MLLFDGRNSADASSGGELADAEKYHHDNLERKVHLADDGQACVVVPPQHARYHTEGEIQFGKSSKRAVLSYFMPVSRVSVHAKCCSKNGHAE